jgi:hypothetical protein
MTDDFENVGAELANLGDLGHADGGQPHPDADAEGWSFREKGEGGVEQKPEDLQKAQEAEFDRIFDEKPDAEAAWAREHRRLADEALQRAGLDPAQRHEAGISRREATRRLYRAEAALRSDPANALATITGDYTSHLDPAGREATARAVLARLGYQSVDGLDQGARQRLQGYDEAVRVHHAELAQVRERLQPVVENFARTHSDYQEHRPMMVALVEAGEAKTIQEAYDLARKVRGLPSSQAEQAQAQAATRRSEVAKAKAASTPNTRSVTGRAEDPLGGLSMQEAQEAAYDRIFGAGG